MFRPVPMVNLRAVVLERDERAVLRDLARMGAVQLRREPAGPGSAPRPPPDHTERRAACDRLLARIQDLGRSLQIPPQTVPPDELPELSFEEASLQLPAMEQRALELQQRQQRLTERRDQLDVSAERLSDFGELEIPADLPERRSPLHVAFGRLHAGKVASLKLPEDALLIALAPRQKQGQPVIAFSTREGQAALESALGEAGFQQAEWPGGAGPTLASRFAELGRERSEIGRALEELGRERREAAEAMARPLADLGQAVRNERLFLEAEEALSRTAASALVSGWVPVDQTPEVVRRLQAITHGRCAVHSSPPGPVPEREIPVLLRHHWLLRPFALLVTAYGLPAYRELEPTPLVALSFTLMFGMMFGDLGHGALLLIAGMAVRHVGRTERGRDAGLLLVYAGLASMAFGLIYGSCFGLPALKHWALWHDPLEGDPGALLAAAMGFGVVLISLGLVLNILNRFSHGDIAGGCLDKFGLAGAVFYWGALVAVTQSDWLRTHPLLPWILLVVLPLAVVAWIVNEPLHHARRHRAESTAGLGGGLGAALIEAFVGSFEALLAYLANTVSFVRLAAYAMSHAALLMAAFTLAAELRSVPDVGPVLGGIVIVLGNLIALVLEGFVASVQALRLEYYEFFSKFFSGSGTPFRPLRLSAGLEDRA